LELRLVNIQAENADFLCKSIAAYLTQRVGLPVEFVTEGSWQERARMLDEGEAHIGFLCGLPYVVNVDGPSPSLNLLAAPVLQGSRYAGKPVCYSDLLVRAESPFTDLSELMGKAIAFNDPTSHSGSGVLRYQLALRGEDASFFGSVQASGSHQTSLAWLLEGRVDAIVMDSMVWDYEVQKDPALAARGRAIETWGPSMAPPFVASRQVPDYLQHRIKNALLGMHLDQVGTRILRSGLLDRFELIQDSDYKDIRAMALKGRSVEWPIGIGNFA
jgi:phosphonate transport system substrate-binding protein